MTLGVSGLLLLLSGGASGGGGAAVPLRLVKSSQDALARTLASSTASLYAKNDRWKPYLASEAACPGGERTDLPLARQQRTLACLVNWARKRRGLEPLALASPLNVSSLRKAEDIARCENFDHSPCGGDWTFYVRAAGYTGAVGENLYLAEGPWRAPRVAVDGWLNSPSHRANLFDPQWRRQGLAAVAISTFQGRRGVTVWVNEFGDR